MLCGSAEKKHYPLQFWGNLGKHYPLSQNTTLPPKHYPPKHYPLHSGSKVTTLPPKHYPPFWFKINITPSSPL